MRLDAVLLLQVMVVDVEKTRVPVVPLLPENVVPTVVPLPILLLLVLLLLVTEVLEYVDAMYISKSFRYVPL